MTPTFAVFQGATVEKVMGGAESAPPPQIGLSQNQMPELKETKKMKNVALYE